MSKTLLSCNHIWSSALDVPKLAAMTYIWTYGLPLQDHCGKHVQTKLLDIQQRWHVKHSKGCGPSIMAAALPTHIDAMYWCISNKNCWPMTACCSAVEERKLVQSFALETTSTCYHVVCQGQNQLPNDLQNYTQASAAWQQDQLPCFGAAPIAKWLGKLRKACHAFLDVSQGTRHVYGAHYVWENADWQAGWSTTRPTKLRFCQQMWHHCVGFVDFE